MKTIRNVGKLSVGQIVPFVAALAVSGLFIAFTAQINGEIEDTMTAGSAEQAAVANVTGGLGNLAGKYGTLGTIAGAALLITLLVSAFAFARQ